MCSEHLHEPCCLLLLLSRSVMFNCFATLWTVAHQTPVSMEFSRQEYWSGLPCPPPWDLPDPGIDPVSLTSNLNANAGSLSLAPPEKSRITAYSKASLVAQMVKNPPAVWETWVQSLGREDPLEEGMAIHSSILARRILIDRGTWQATVHGVAKNWTQLSY